MGKNLQATMCALCDEGLCYYGATVCLDCQNALANNTPKETIEEVQQAIKGGEE
tara:strand:+ start:397 stop:558 length:162 start_codon:yes stop_codon:yes gene_type:complete